VIDALERAVGRPVPRETLARLRLYADLLAEESRSQNLIAPSTLGRIWERHILDSAQLARFEPHAAASWVDVGSGAGLPGIVIACLVDGPITLIEPRKLRAQFLRDVIEKLDLNVAVECRRAETAEGRFDVITGRAVAPLTQFLRISHHLSTKKTVWALPKGRGAQSELAEAESTWQGVFHVEQSVTDRDSYIVVGTGVRRK
jgi:16S rRNA (guanine527-N7)-methyltransferase